MGHGTLNKLHRKLELKIFKLRAVKERKNKYARKFILMKYICVFWNKNLCLIAVMCTCLIVYTFDKFISPTRTLEYQINGVGGFFLICQQMTPKTLFEQYSFFLGKRKMLL